MTDTKLDKLIQNILNKEQFDGATISQNEQYYITDDDYFATKNDLETKQDVIDDLDSIRTGASKGATALQSVPYSGTDKAGVIKSSGSWSTSVNTTGYLMSTTRTLDTYKSANANSFISKGTLENIKEDLVTSIGDVKYQDKYVFDISKFTIVGSPTITDDSIASGFTTSNFVELNPSIFENIGNKNYTYSISFTMGSVTTGEQTIYCEGRDSGWLSKGFQFGTAASSGNLICSLRGSDGAHIARNLNLSDNALEPYSTHTLRLEYNNGEYKFYLDNVLRSTVTSSSIKSYQGLNPTLGIYNFNDTTQYYFPFGGSIDLKQFSITVDGVEVFNGYHTVEQALDNKVNMLQASSASMPSNKFIDLTLGVDGSSYTAPANGWLYLVKVANGSGQYVSIDVDNKYSVENSGIASGNWIRVLCPIRKGKSATIGYSAGGETKYFRFIYAEGSVQ